MGQGGAGDREGVASQRKACKETLNGRKCGILESENSRQAEKPRERRRSLEKWVGTSGAEPPKPRGGVT